MFEIDKKKFGAFVSEARKEKGYTQRELGEKLFISDKAVSKWETGMSIPDTALLVPLAELLGVTVMELLMCERVVKETPMDTAQVESIVKTAIAYSDESAMRAWRVRSWWPIIYLLCVAIGAAAMALGYVRRSLSEEIKTVFILGAIFGAYFCFFVKTRLPSFYDGNRCGLYYDGFFRMNVPGVAFNNANWPHVVRVGRIWSCASVALYPMVDLVMSQINAALWARIDLYACLALLLGGLVVPLYVVGRKYE